eukprot:8597079-Pyramimonas_sp.AAC.1
MRRRGAPRGAVLEQGIHITCVEVFDDLRPGQVRQFLRSPLRATIARIVARHEEPGADIRVLGGRIEERDLLGRARRAKL